MTPCANAPPLIGAGRLRAQPGVAIHAAPPAAPISSDRRVTPPTDAAYGEQAGILLPAAAAVFAVELVLFIVLFSISAGLALIASVVGIIFSTFYTGMVVGLVSDVQDGRRDQSVGDLFAAVTPVFWPLIGASIVVAIGVGIGLVLIIVPGLIFLTWWAVTSPVIVLERPGVFAALGRSRALVRDNGWQVFAVLVFFFVISAIAGGIVGAIGASGGTVGRAIGQFVASTATAPLGALAASVMYFELLKIKGEPTPAAAGLPADPGLETTVPPLPPQDLPGT